VENPIADCAFFLPDRHFFRGATISVPEHCMKYLGTLGFPSGQPLQFPMHVLFAACGLALAWRHANAKPQAVDTGDMP
jgi:hypothetical protein